MLVQCCPKCGRVLPGEDINDDTKIAFCRVCNLSHDLKKLKRTPIHAPNADLGFPPSGTWYRDTGMEKTAGATCRSIPGAVVCGITALFWNVPVLALLVINAIATLGALGIRLPEWLPVQLRDAGSKMHVCMTGFIWLFMTPFVLIGLAMIDAFLSYLWGKVEVTVAGGIGSLTTPFCGFTKRKPFNPAQVRHVWIGQKRHRSKHGTRTSYHILMEMTEGKPIKFGSYLRDDRRDFVAAALKAALGLRAG